MEIRTISQITAETFDEKVNAAIAEGFQLMRREHITAPNLDKPAIFYAELVKPDAPPPVDAWQEAVRVIHDTCTNAKSCGSECPMKDWCDQHFPAGGESLTPADWEVPGVD